MMAPTPLESRYSMPDISMRMRLIPMSIRLRTEALKPGALVEVAVTAQAYDGAVVLDIPNLHFHGFPPAIAYASK